MRTEVIGLQSWLASVGVPGILPQCDCRWQESQTVRHILLHCPNYDRTALIRETGTEVLRDMLSRPDRAQAAAKWFVVQEIPPQLHVARDINNEDTRHLLRMPGLRDWE
jgi:hypothetical protein